MPADDLTTTFDGDAAQLQQLRRIVADALAGEVPVEVLDAAVLLTSELATNALTHGRPPYRLRLAHHDQVVRVDVADGRGGGSVQVRHPRTDEPGGRGLLLVDALATGWGVEEGDAARTVWFELRY